MERAEPSSEGLVRHAYRDDVRCGKKFQKLIWLDTNLALSTSQVIRKLKQLYPTHAFAVANGRNPYRILISCILSLRTQDTVSIPASKRLFKRAPTLQKMAKLTTRQIAKLIYPVGFYKNKAKQISQINRLLLTKHRNQVPNSREELLKFKGVGRKTANLVLSLGYGIPAICVDTHVHRISNRLGWVRSKTPEDTEQLLMQLLPRRDWISINHIMVSHGQNLCKPRTPRCSLCPVRRYCRFGLSQNK